MRTNENHRHHISHQSFWAAITALMLVASTCSAPVGAEPRNRQGRDPENRTMLFATTRLDESGDSSPMYAGKRHIDFGYGSLDYGAVKVKRPSNLIQYERAPNWFSYLEEMKSNDDQWQAAPVATPRHLDESQMLSRIKDSDGTICIFVHGYLKSFDNATRDAAVVAYELDRRNNWENPTLPILFSWPSADKLRDYAEDEANAEWSALAFADFIDKVNQNKNPNSKVLLVAHSLGTRLVFSLLNNPELIEKQPIDRLILSASDYDYFQARQRLEKLEQLVKERIYVFVSDRDGPLITSQLLHGSPRLGRPFDPPRPKTAMSDYMSKEGWQQLLQQAADIVMPGGLNNPPEAATWMQRKPELVCEFGSKSKFIDVSELVSKDAGHRLAWPVIAGLLIDDPSLAPLTTSVVLKRPDQTTLDQNGGSPPQLYRFYRVSGNNYGARTAAP